MKVFTLVTADDPAMLSSTLLFLDTIRVGFPTAEIQVFDNFSKTWWYKEGTIWRQKLDKAGLILRGQSDFRYHHADWIRGVVERTDGPYAIVDPDTIWWENCENFSANIPISVAGYMVPEMWNEWAGCPSHRRLHTSFLWVPDGVYLRECLHKAYPQHGPYRPFNPFSPCVEFVGGDCWFRDTFCNATHALHYSCEVFSDNVKERYDHLNSASFYSEMEKLVDRPDGFREVHRLARENPTALRGLWREVDAYYERMARKLDDMEVRSGL
jgi:hypothetical protein